MFTIKKRDTSSLDAAIQRILTQMEVEDPDREEFAKLVEHLERLTELRDGKRTRVSPDTMFTAGANLLGILVIVAYEQKHIFGSKAVQFLARPRM